MQIIFEGVMPLQNHYWRAIAPSAPLAQPPLQSVIYGKIFVITCIIVRCVGISHFTD